MRTPKTCVRNLADEVARLLPKLFEEGAYGSVEQYAGFLQRIMVGFADVLTSERTYLTPAEKALLRELADNPLLEPLDARADIEAVHREWAG